MTSLLTNYAAMSAARTLSATQAKLSGVQSQISTGLKVATAEDNAAYWSIATSMKTRVGTMRAVNDGLDLTSAILSTTAAALTSIIASTHGIVSDLVTAKQAGVDPAALDHDIAARQSSILSATRSANFNGINLLVGNYTVNTIEDDDLTYDESYAGHQAQEAANIGSYNSSGAHHQITTAVDQFGNNFSETISYPETEHFTWGVGGYGTGGQAYISLSSSSGPSFSVPGGTENVNSVGLSVPSSASDTSIQSIVIDTSRISLFSEISGNATRTPIFNGQSLAPTTQNSSSQLSYLGPYAADAHLQGSGIFDSLAGLRYDAGNGYEFFEAPSTLTLRISYTDDPNQVSALDHDANLSVMTSTASTTLYDLMTAAAYVGTLQNAVDSARQNNSAIIDALRSGISSLVDADMNQDSARLQALQTQQQLGVQALGIANDNNQIIMKLFAG